MPIATRCKSIVGAELFQPVSRFLESSRFRRNCPALPDDLWLTAGIRRCCLGLFQSGRDFLQDLGERQDTEILPTTFFESLKSKRRLALLSDLLAKSQIHMRREMPDPFAAFKSLDAFDLYAGDGHFIAAACHDKAAPRKTPAKKSKAKAPGRTAAFPATKYATGHLYALDLRSHGMTHLTVSDQQERNKEHDMRALKRQTIETLRQGAAKGRKVLYSAARHLSGSRTQTIYVYLTNLPVGVPPGIVALLYKSRWDVEKVFDEFKNKLGETKSWGSTANAKTCQARLLCLTHNLMTLMEEKIFRETGIHNQAETKRKSSSAG